MTLTTRRRLGQRLSTVLWGVLVIGTGMLMIASFSGHDIDLELAAILLLAGIGGWLLISAALSGLGRRRQVAAATAPVTEEPLTPETEPVTQEPIQPD